MLIQVWLIIIGLGTVVWGLIRLGIWFYTEEQKRRARDRYYLRRHNEGRPSPTPAELDELDKTLEMRYGPSWPRLRINPNS